MGRGTSLVTGARSEDRLAAPVPSLSGNSEAGWGVAAAIEPAPYNAGLDGHPSVPRSGGGVGWDALREAASALRRGPRPSLCCQGLGGWGVV